MESKNLHKIYLFIGIISCTIYSILTPPCVFPDENHHYFRITTLAEGILFPTDVHDNNKSFYWYNLTKVYVISPNRDTYYTVNVDKDHIEFMEGDLRIKDIFSDKTKIRENEKVEMYLAPTKFYLFTGYIIPSSFYFIISKFSDNLYIRLVFARLFSGIFFCWLISLSIKYIKKFSIQLFFIGSLPMTYYLFSSISPDGLLITSSFIFASLLINASLSEKLTPNYYLPFSILAVLLSCTKPLYFAVPFTIWTLIPKNPKELKFCIFITLLSLISFLVPYYFMNRFYPSPVPIEIIKDSQYSILFFLTHPSIGINKILYFLSNEASLITKQLFCTYGWTRFYLPTKVYFIYYIFGIIAVFTTSGNKELSLSKTQSRTVFSISLFGIGLIFLAFLLYKNCEGVCGIQGRYFLPFLTLLIIPINNLFGLDSKFNKYLQPTLIYGIIVLNFISLSYFMFCWYYFWK